MRVLGIDLSLNHAAFVELIDDSIRAFLVVTSTKSIAAQTDGTILISADAPTKDDHAVARLGWWRTNLPLILANFDPERIAFEDYAYSAKHSAHQIGEVGGLLRLALLDYGRPWRRYAPDHIKLFAAHNAKAEKVHMIDACRERWGVDWAFLIPPGTKREEAAGDAADATAIAYFLRSELLVRAGTRQLTDLHEAERRAFLKTSKHFEENLLARPFAGETK